MFTIKHIRAGAASILGLLALGLGGSAIAGAAQSTPNATPAAATTTVDTPTAGDTADTSTAVDVPTAGDKADGAADVPTAGDKADTGTESGSEIPGADGPGGHADESPAQR